MIWVWISKATGMPLAVEKCDFQPTINHNQNPGDWIGHVDQVELADLRAQLAAALNSFAQCSEFLETVTKERDALLKVLEAGTKAARDVLDFAAEGKESVPIVYLDLANWVAVWEARDAK